MPRFRLPLALGVAARGARSKLESGYRICDAASLDVVLDKRRNSRARGRIEAYPRSDASRFAGGGSDRALASSQSVDIHAGESSSGLKSTVGHGKARQVLGASRKALEILASSPPSERTIKKFGMPGRPTGAGAEGELAAPLLDTARDHHRFRIRCRRIRCCAVTTLAYRLAPDWLWLAI